MPIAATAMGNPLLFTGRRFDPESGRYFFRTRYLDPVVGRFTIRDTIGIWGDPINLGNGYAYVGNNPWTALDPTGEGTSIYEKGWCIGNLCCCASASDSGADVHQMMKKVFGDYGDGTKENAIKHCTWMCLVPSIDSCSQDAARKLGEAHEARSDNSEQDKAMDLHNNEVGLNIGGKNIYECLQKCRIEADRCTLRWYAGEPCEKK